MGIINIGTPIDTSLIKCCSCGKGYEIKGNLYEDNILICPHCGLKHKIDFTLFDKKIENLKKVDRLNLTVIDIGNTAEDRNGDVTYNNTFINRYNPALYTGKITSVEIWAGAQMAGCEVAIFYRPDPIGFPNKFTTRSYATVNNGNGAGVVLAGSKQTFVVDFDVVVGDYIGIYYTAGTLDYTKTGGIGNWYFYPDQIPCTNTTFLSNTVTAGLSLRGLGSTVTSDFVYAGEGSFAYSGTATQSHTKNYLHTGTGTFNYSGIGLYVQGFVYTASGSFLFSGEAYCVQDWVYTATGSFIYSGTAIQEHTKEFIYVADGSFIYSGTAVQSYTFNYSCVASGTLRFSGIGLYSTGFSYVASGTYNFSGVATYVLEFAYTGSGTLAYSGAGRCSWDIPIPPNEFHYVSTGSFTYSGSAAKTYTRNYLYSGSGEFIYSGSAVVEKYNFISVGSGTLIFSGEADFTFYCNWIEETKSDVSWTEEIKPEATWTEEEKPTTTWTEEEKMDFGWLGRGWLVYGFLNDNYWTEEEKVTITWTEEEK